MPDLKISQLPAATTPLAGTELVPIVQSGTTDKVTVADLTAGRAVSASALTASSGNLTFSGTAQRITGDFSNATATNRLAFQTSTVNGNTTIHALPNGTAAISAYRAFNNSDPTNAGYAMLYASSTEIRVDSAIFGTGTYLPMTFQTGGSERMRIDTSGNVGVGTASPGTRLDIQAATASTLLKSTTGTNYAAHFLNNTGGFTYLGIESSTGGSLFSGTAAYSAVFGTVSAYPVALATNNAERMRIDSSGNVGIGTASPSSRLDVSGSGTQTVRSATVDTSGAAVGRFRAVYTGGGGGAASAVDLRAGDGYTYLLTETNSPLLFGTNAAERLRIDASGNVVQNTAAVATNATAGFLWITSCAGAPTGAPTAPYTNAAALVCDTTNNRLYVRVGSTWRYATLT